MSIHTEAYPQYSATETAFRYLAECLMLDFKIAEASGRQVDLVGLFAESMAASWLAGANEVECVHADEADLGDITNALKEVHLRCQHPRADARATGYTAILEHARTNALAILESSQPAERSERLQVLVQEMLTERARLKAQNTVRGT